MPPKSLSNRLADAQAQFANAIRHNDTQAFGVQFSSAMGVYARLVRNNAFGFIDRCFTEAVAHVTMEDWASAKEAFVQRGKAHSPYFQDIATEFLAFCQDGDLFDESVLALMDFECKQLLAEVAIEDIPDNFEWRADTSMRLSKTAQLASYEVDFISSDFGQFITEPTQVLVWRDSQFLVHYQILTAIDYYLLSLLQEQTCSYHELLEALAELVAQDAQIEMLLEQAWQKWIEAEVIFPTNEVK